MLTLVRSKLKSYFENLDFIEKSIGYTIDDIKNIKPLICMHSFILENNYKPFIEPQRPLNPNMKEVVNKEVLKLIDVVMIYPISNNACQSYTGSSKERVYDCSEK